MAYDGRLLALAREELSEIRRKNAQELEKRRRELFSASPELAEVERSQRRLMDKIVFTALGEGNVDERALENESESLQRRKENILRSMGLPYDYIDGVYSCAKCRDSGYAGGKMCFCLKELYKKQASRELSCIRLTGDASFDTFDLSLYDSVQDSRGGLSPRKRMERTFAMAKNYAYGFGKQSPNLMFQGGTGLGKTFLSACIARVVSEKGFSVVYETSVAALEAFEVKKFARTPEMLEAAEEKVRKYLGCELMILDDLGTEMITSLSTSALYTLINERLSSGKKTIISTNLSTEELRRAYSAQIVSRLEGEYLTLVFDGRDIRTVKKERKMA